MNLDDFLDKKLRALGAEFKQMQVPDITELCNGAIGPDAPPHVTQHGPLLQLWATQVMGGALEHWDKERREGEKQRDALRAADQKAREAEAAEAAKQAKANADAKAVEAQKVAQQAQVAAAAAAAEAQKAAAAQQTTT